MGYSCYIRLGYFCNLFSENAIFMALSCSFYLLVHIIAFIFDEGTAFFLTQSKIITFYVWWHGSKYLKFHKNSLWHWVNQTTSSSPIKSARLQPSRPYWNKYCLQVRKKNMITTMLIVLNQVVSSGTQEKYANHNFDLIFWVHDKDE